MADPTTEAESESRLALISPVLAAFPWTTTVIMDNDVFLNNYSMSSVQPLYAKIRKFEESIFSSRDANAIEHRHVLQVQLASSGILEPSSYQPLEGQYKVWGQRLSALSSYRLLDVIAHISGVGVRLAPPIAKRRYGQKPKPLELWSSLNNWTKLLNEFRTSALKAKHGTPTVRSKKPRSVLINWLMYCDNQKSISKIMTNLLVVAIHLNSLRNGACFPEVGPHITQANIFAIQPDEGLALTVGKDAGNQEAGSSELVFPSDQEVTTGEVTLKQRIPLYLAVCISPLYLLLPSVLLKRKSFTGRNVLDTSVALGNCKPAALVSAESVIWNALFQLADGTLQPDQLLGVLLDSIPWDEICSCSSEDKKWFSFDEPTFSQEPSAFGLVSQISSIPSSESGLTDSSTAVTDPARSSEIKVEEEGDSQEPICSQAPQPKVSHSSQSLAHAINPVLVINSAHDGSASEPHRLDDGATAHSMQDMDDVDEYNAADQNPASPMAISDDSASGSDVPSKYSQSNQLQDSHMRDNDSSLSEISTPKGKKVAFRISSRKKNPRSAPPAPPTSSKKIIPPSRTSAKRDEPKNLKRKREDEARSFSYVIDLTADLEEEEPQPKAIPSSLVRKVHGPAIELYTVDGGVRVIRPAFHFEEYLENFTQLVKASKSRASEGKPLYLTNPERSSVRVMSEAEFDGCSTSDVQAIFKTKHIVVTGHGFHPCRFDIEALRKIARENQPLCVNDLSVQVKARLIKATIRDILSHASDENGRALNTLDLPMEDGAAIPATLSSERWAWQHTINKKLCKASDWSPTSAMRWALVSTAGTHSPWHLDPEGLATMVQVQNEGGLKVWFVAVERDEVPFNTTDVFFGNLDADKPNAEKWDVEAIVLTPGAKFFMRPNTPHWVYTPTNTICYGGHFYATSTIRDTCYGLMHSFIASRVTNTEHEAASRELLRRMITYYHVTYVESTYPDCDRTHAIDIESFDGFIDFLTLFNTAELLNALYTESYRLDGASLRDQLSFVEARRLCRIVLAWFSVRYEILASEGRSLSPAKLQQIYLGGQVRALLRYKYLEEEDRKTDGGLDSGIGFAELRLMIERRVDGGVQLVKEYQRLLVENPGDHYFKYLSWPSTERYDLRKKGTLEGPAD